jgi:hypothetical protein
MEGEAQLRRSGITSGWEHHTGSQAPAICFDFNKGHCTRGSRCPYHHICRQCQGAHPAVDHDRATGGSEVDANSAPLGSRPKRQ